MSPQIVFLIVLLATILVVFLGSNMLKDKSDAMRKPYSFARVQLTWWSLIVLACFITIVATRGIPTFDASTLILLGISSATTAAARVVDASDKSNGKTRIQDQNSQNILLDILSDENGVSIHRFQTVIFNLTFGIWFLCQVYSNLSASDVNAIMPVITTNNLVLLGLSSGTYAALKTNENKLPIPQAPPDAQAESVPDESIDGAAKAKG
jgi:hypothetical protein